MPHKDQDIVDACSRDHKKLNDSLASLDKEVTAFVDVVYGLEGCDVEGANMKAAGISIVTTLSGIKSRMKLPMLEVERLIGAANEPEPIDEEEYPE